MTRTQENIAVIRATDTVSKAHAWLCHSDGSTCEDGCNVEAFPDRLARFHEAWDDSAAMQHVTGQKHPCDDCKYRDGRDLAWCGGCDARLDFVDLRPYVYQD